MNVSEITLNLQWLIYWLNEGNNLGKIDIESLNEYLKGLKKSVKEFNSNFLQLSKEIKKIR